MIILCYLFNKDLILLLLFGYINIKKKLFSDIFLILRT